MKSNFMLIGALIALISFAVADVSENDGIQTASEEPPVQKVHVLNPGEKEYLSPNLIGVQNIAVTNIPVTMDFINIIDAFREVVDGVRYEIVLNAVNTTDNNTEVVCRIVVLEKPWLTTLWGDKVRLLQESNCTSEELKDSPRDSKALEEKYQTNALFTGNRNELTADDMSKLESQIIGSSNPQLTRQRTTTSTTESVIKAEAEQVTESVVVVESTSQSVDIQPEAESNGDDNSAATTAEEPIVASTESSTTTTSTEKLPELNDDEKKWLDDFLSIGAYNFETSLQNKAQSGVNNEAQLSDQENDKREKRQIAGGVRPLDEQELKLEEEAVTKAFAKLATGDGPTYTIVKVHSGTKQVVAGTLTKLKVDLRDEATGTTAPAVVSLLSQPGLKKEITVEWEDKPKVVHRVSRSVDERKKRHIAGGVRPLDEQELKLEEEAVTKTFAKLATGDGPTYTIVKVHSGTKQVVSGTLTKLKVDLRDDATGTTAPAVVSLWSQPWLEKDGYEITVEWEDKPKVVHRVSRSVDEIQRRSKRSLVGGATPLNEDQLKEQEEKVSKSLVELASGDGPSYSISKVYNGTKQIVAGTLVKINAELIDGTNGAKQNCTISLWSRPWVPVDGYEISFECDDKQKETYRHSRSVEYAQKKSHKKNHRSLDKADHLFQKFQMKFNKNYHTSMERQMRLRIFRHNLKLIQDLNKHEMGSAKYGITEFADMTTTEYRERTGLLSREESNSVRSQAKIPDVELPKEFDWREKGAISAVKNQGNCGSCWAFSVTGNIEGLHAVKTGKLEEYSEQELLDCDTVDSACQGGLPDNAYQAIEKIGGLELESEYPYEAKKGRCHFNSSLAHVKISGAVDLPKNETAMAQWLITNGPISIGINANAMQFYRGGVSHPWKVLCSKGNLDHGVLIVGYGVSDYPMFKKTLPYWIVKNSWGPKWGEQGYYRVYRGDNTCGLSEMATSAILAS